ncbi:LOW QUALITY PROTEIN: hypothetical protein PHMEG_00037438 [Phytophthora megakarya]|uniref:Uncharacterized protein n=1 Tax=Phytophthora megakarya TaxID=4795 RepID=A0A225UM69_9STRA|nr:LOW QUALITY PROTEIN: hypothetical protein PHMEG_00037438 [Phytophthora megakarya]
MMNNDFVDEIADYIHALELNESKADSSAFTFGWRKDDNGHIEVGIGSDEKPFVVGVTSKQLLSRLDRPVNSFLCVSYATFKVAEVEYPVLVCGMSDRCQSFHLVALFVTSQRLETQYTEMLKFNIAFNALRLVYFRIMQKSLKVLCHRASYFSRRVG